MLSSSSLPFPFSSVVQLKIANENNEKNEQLWEEFITRVRECLVLSFETIMNSYEDEIRKADAKRRDPSWNFSGFYLLKVRR